MMTIVYKKVPVITVVAYNNYIAANIEKGGFLLLVSAISVVIHHKEQMIAIVCHQSCLSMLKVDFHC